MLFPGNVRCVTYYRMSTDVPTPEHSDRTPKVTVTPDRVAVTDSDPFTATARVPVARVPASQLLNEPVTGQATPTPQPTSKTTTPTARSACSQEVANLIDALTALLRAFPASAIPNNLTAFPKDPAILQQMIVELLQALRRKDRDLEETRRRLDALLRPRSKPVDPDQPSLFPDVETPPITPPAPPPPEPEPSSRRGQCKPHGRRRPAAELRRVQKRYELTATERLCPGCGHERREIGVETTEQYDYKPAEVFVIEHQQVKYACRCCEGHVAQAPKPPQPIDKGLPGPGLLAQIGTDKYLDHIPLNRSEQRFERLGLDLPRSTMCDWMAACAELLTPLWLLLKAHVLMSKVLHTDDTTVPVRDEKLSQHRYGRLWDYIGDITHPGVVFDYTTSHARDGPATFLKDFRGFLQADAYGVYDGIYTGSKGAIVEVGCWAHARNKFTAALGTDPERVLAAKAWVRRLYDVEDEAKEKSSAERLRLRQEKSVPLLDSFHQWLLTQKAQVLPKSPIATAINYVLNQWEALKRYTTDGDLHIDNNISERTLKLIGMGRVNWLFVGSDKGGRTAAVLFSFTATCKCLGIDSFSYLRDVFDRLPTHPEERLGELLPHRWQVAQAAARLARV
jgi:transposase